MRKQFHREQQHDRRPTRHQHRPPLQRRCSRNVRRQRHRDTKEKGQPHHGPRPTTHPTSRVQQTHHRQRQQPVRRQRPQRRAHPIRPLEREIPLMNAGGVRGHRSNHQRTTAPHPHLQDRKHHPRTPRGRLAGSQTRSVPCRPGRSPGTALATAPQLRHSHSSRKHQLTVAPRPYRCCRRPAEGTNLRTAEQLGGGNCDRCISRPASSEDLRTWSRRANLRSSQGVRHDQPLIATPAGNSNPRPSGGPVVSPEGRSTAEDTTRQINQDRSGAQCPNRAGKAAFLMTSNNCPGSRIRDGEGMPASGVVQPRVAAGRWGW